MEHQHHHSDKSGISWAFWLNLLFSIIEIVGGFFTNSTAIIADAFHDFADAVAIGVAVLLEKLSGKRRTSKFSYGYKRFSLLSALGMSLFLLIGAVFMCIGSYQSFVSLEPVNSTGMLWLAALGIGINGFAFLKIKNGHHHHQQSHSHNHNSKAIMLHLLEDVLGWVAVLIGAVFIYFTGWYWIDGVLALAIAVFIGYNATRNFIGTMKILLQSVPESVNIEKLSSELHHISGVQSIHDIHVWSIDGSYNIGSLHAVVHTIDSNRQNDILSAILQVMKKHKIQHPTIQIEMNATNCKFVTC